VRSSHSWFGPTKIGEVDEGVPDIDREYNNFDRGDADERESMFRRQETTITRTKENSIYKTYQTTVHVTV
jgi:hypothetical protein